MVNGLSPISETKLLISSLFDQAPHSLFSRQESWLKNTFTITMKTGFTVLSDMSHTGISSKDEKKRFSSKWTRNWKRLERGE